jgi:hypothetical protein
LAPGVLVGPFRFNHFTDGGFRDRLPDPDLIFFAGSKGRVSPVARSRSVKSDTFFQPDDYPRFSSPSAETTKLGLIVVDGGDLR